jgi:hypothetical protein
MAEHKCRSGRGGAATHLGKENAAALNYTAARRQVSAWQRLIREGNAADWQTDQTASGKLRFRRSGSTVFGPGPDAPEELHVETLERLRAVERLAERCRPA